MCDVTSTIKDLLYLVGTTDVDGTLLELEFIKTGVVCEPTVYQEYMDNNARNRSSAVSMLSKKCAVNNGSV